MANNNENFDPMYSPQQNGDGLRKFSDELITKFKGKILELYIGDQYESLNFDDFSQQQNATIYGRLVDVLDRFLILDCFYIDKLTGKLSTGNLVYINTFQIRAMGEVNHTGSLDDIFLSAKDVSKIRKLLHIESKHVKMKNK